MDSFTKISSINKDCTSLEILQFKISNWIFNASIYSQKYLTI
jgi:hypothetical protein